MMDKINYQFYKSVGKIGTGKSQIKHPQGLTIDPLTQNIYVVDEGNRKIIVYNLEGEHQFEFPNKSDYILKGAHGIAIKFEMGFVTEEFRGTISVFSLEGDFLTRFSTGSVRNTKHHQNTSMSLRTMRICDNLPTGITIARDGSIFVCNCFKSKIVIFTMELAPQICELSCGSLAKDVKFINDTTLAVLNGDSNCIWLIDLETNKVKSIKVANAVFFDVLPNECILINDYENNLIKIISLKGKLIKIIGESEQFKSPTGIALSSETGTLVSVSRKEDSPIQLFKLRT